MEKLREKLNSQRGVSILMALLALLVAIMVSMVVVSAALSAAHAVADDQEIQQDQLTVSSAARLFMDEAAGKSRVDAQQDYYVPSGTWTWYTHTLRDGEYVELASPTLGFYQTGTEELGTVDVPGEYAPDGAFNWLLTQVIPTDGSPVVSPAPFTMTLQGDSEMKPVNVAVQVSESGSGSRVDYDVAVTFSIEGKNAMTVYATASKAVTVSRGLSADALPSAVQSAYNTLNTQTGTACAALRASTAVNPTCTGIQSGTYHYDETRTAITWCSRENMRLQKGSTN